MGCIRAWPTIPTAPECTLILQTLSLPSCTLALLLSMQHSTTHGEYCLRPDLYVVVPCYCAGMVRGTHLVHEVHSPADGQCYCTNCSARRMHSCLPPLSVACPVVLPAVLLAAGWLLVSCWGCHLLELLLWLWGNVCMIVLYSRTLYISAVEMWTECCTLRTVVWVL